MRPHLILIGGAPGVGKSSLGSHLLERLSNSVWLDGDDLWRMNPFTVNERTKAMVMKNIRFMLASFLETGFSHVIFTWVMHEPQIVETILDGLTNVDYSRTHITLTCSWETLCSRISGDLRQRVPELAAERLKQCINNYPNAICTDDLTPDQIADIALLRIRH